MKLAYLPLCGVADLINHPLLFNHYADTKYLYFYIILRPTNYQYNICCFDSGAVLKTVLQHSHSNIGPTYRVHWEPSKQNTFSNAVKYWTIVTNDGQNVHCNVFCLLGFAATDSVSVQH